MKIVRPDQPLELQKAVQQELYTAIRKGDPRAVAQCLAQGADPNAREIRFVKPTIADTSDKDTEEGDTPLILAMERGERDIKDETREAIVRLLLDKGADVNKAGVVGFTPLIEAVRYHYPRMTLLLLQRGAKPDQQTKFGQTALTFAINIRLSDMVEMLLRYRANANGPADSDQRTPLMEAVSRGAYEIVELLLRRGADPNICRRGWTALELAARDEGEYSNAKAAEMLRHAGARGPLPEKLKPAFERAKQERLEYSLQSDRQRRKQATRFQEECVVVPEDSLVIEAALLDMLAYQGGDLFQNDSKKSAILIESETAPGPGLVDEGQMDSELSTTQARDITREMRGHLLRRNSEPVLLLGVLRFNDPRIQMQAFQPTKQESTDPSWFKKNYPDVRYHVAPFLPGYNRKHDLAILRFWFGPFPHGAAGASYLVRTTEGWRVSWQKFSYFS